MIEDYDDRHHKFEGCFNFRDIGGYATEDGRSVKWGLYFRAGRQDRMSEADLERLNLMSIRTQIDLRKPEEVADQGRGPLESLGAAYHNIAVIPDGGSDELARLVGDTGISGKRYLGYLEFGSETWLKLFDLFADPAALPLLIHCTAGKDRTGVSTAFLLTVLGVPRPIIEADYILTNRDVTRQVDYVESTIGLPTDMDRPTLLHAAGVPEEAMADFLDGLEEKYGGALNYLHEIGITDAQMAQVRENFLH
ncbi:MAG: tyrosine-protein phosphatase [Pseudomonadales bacterium]